MTPTKKKKTYERNSGQVSLSFIFYYFEEENDKIYLGYFLNHSFFQRKSPNLLKVNRHPWLLEQRRQIQDK